MKAPNFISLVIVLFFTAFLTTSLAYSQIGKPKTSGQITEIGKVERLLGNFYSLYTLTFKEIEPNKRFYILVFTNENTLYDNSKDVDNGGLGFYATHDEFDYIYDFLRAGFKSSEYRSLEVGKGIVKTLPNSKRFLYINVDFEDGTSAMLKLTKRQLAKLFGKK